MSLFVSISLTQYSTVCMLLFDCRNECLMHHKAMRVSINSTEFSSFVAVKLARCVKENCVSGICNCTNIEYIYRKTKAFTEHCRVLRIFM